VVGSYAVNGGAVQDAFLWTEATGFHDLGDLVQGGLTAAGWANLADAFKGSLVDAYDGNGGPYIIGDGALGSGSGGVFELTPSVSLAGDYNSNGIVDAADYTIWRDTLGSTADLRANGDNTGASAGKIDQADYTVWKTNFGRTAGSGSGTGTNATVPEPTTLVLLMFAVAGWCLKRGRAT
jgi:hypothetical protein